MDVALSFSIVGASTRYAYTNLLLLFCLSLLFLLLYVVFVCVFVLCVSFLFWFVCFGFVAALVVVFVVIGGCAVFDGDVSVGCC